MHIQAVFILSGWTVVSTYLAGLSRPTGNAKDVLALWAEHHENVPYCATAAKHDIYVINLGFTVVAFWLDFGRPFELIFNE